MTGSYLISKGARENRRYEKRKGTLICDGDIRGSGGDADEIHAISLPAVLH